MPLLDLPRELLTHIVKRLPTPCQRAELAQLHPQLRQAVADSWDATYYDAWVPHRSINPNHAAAWGELCAELASMRTHPEFRSADIQGYPYRPSDSFHTASRRPLATGQHSRVLAYCSKHVPRIPDVLQTLRDTLILAGRPAEAAPLTAEIDAGQAFFDAVKSGDLQAAIATLQVSGRIISVAQLTISLRAMFEFDAPAQPILYRALMTHLSAETFADLINRDAMFYARAPDSFKSMLVPMMRQLSFEHFDAIPGPDEPLLTALLNHVDFKSQPYNQIKLLHANAHIPSSAARIIAHIPKLRSNSAYFCERLYESGRPFARVKQACQALWEHLDWTAQNGGYLTLLDMASREGDEDFLLKLYARGVRLGRYNLRLTRDAAHAHWHQTLARLHQEDTSQADTVAGQSTSNP